MPAIEVMRANGESPLHRNLSHLRSPSLELNLGLQVVESSTTFAGVSFLKATKETVGGQSASSNG